MALEPAAQLRSGAGHAAREAIAVLAKHPDHEPAMFDLIHAANVLGPGAEGAVVLAQGLALAPGRADLLVNLGGLKDDLAEPSAALTLYRRALLLAPIHPAIFNNLGSVLRGVGRSGEALDALRRAMIVAPDFAAPASGLGNVYRDLAKFRAASAWYDRAILLAPDAMAYRSNRLFLAHYIPGTTAVDLQALHREWGQTVTEARRIAIPAIKPARPLRVGFSSPDFAVHPIGAFTLGLFAAADREDMVVHAYNDRPQPDQVTAQLMGSSDIWRDTAALDHDSWRRLIRSDDLDLLIELAGHTAGNRLAAMVHRAAPVQASWAGYVGTTGLATIDLLIADRHHVADADRAAYDETVVCLPESYISYTPFTSPPPIPPIPRAGGPVFSAFANPAKLNADLLGLWADLLARIPGSTLLLRYRGLSDPAQRARLERPFASRGVSADRLTCEEGGNPADMISQYGRVDVVLDTHPYAGGLTTLEALSMGVPVVTLPGATFASRHAASHLMVAGLGNWVAGDAGSYLDLAAGMAKAPPSTRQAIRASLNASPLMDHPRFARDFVAAIRLALRG